MSKQVQIRRGTTAENAAFTGVEGEVTYDTQALRLITHDGATVGGTLQAKLAEVELVANKDTDGTLAANSDTKYPSQKAVKTYADTKQAALGFTAENVANKDTDGTLAANSDTKYPSQKAIKTYSDLKVLKAGDTMTGTLTITPAANTSAFSVSGLSLTAANAQSVLDLAGTWNTSGIPTAIKLNITNTASAPSSRLMDLQVGGVSKFAVGRPHIVNGSDTTAFLDMATTWNTSAVIAGIKLNITDTASSSSSLLLDLQVAAASKLSVNKAGLLIFGPETHSFDGTIFWNAITAAGNQMARLGTTQFSIPEALGIGTGASGPSSPDVFLARDAANILARRNGTNAQINRFYGTFTDASNYERLSFITQAAATTLIDTEAAGTGTRRGLTILSASGTLGFFGVTPVVRQTQGATLTNNVTSGGSANTLANYTDLTIYTNDAAAIRNNIYQLGQTLKVIVDGLRANGLFT